MRLLRPEEGTHTKLPAQVLLSLLQKSCSFSGLIYTKGMFAMFICYFSITVLLFTHGMELTLHEWLGITTGKITDRPMYLELLLRGKCGNVWLWEDLD